MSCCLDNQQTALFQSYTDIIQIGNFFLTEGCNREIVFDLGAIIMRALYCFDKTPWFNLYFLFNPVLVDATFNLILCPSIKNYGSTYFNKMVLLTNKLCLFSQNRFKP